jgi:hypothetical protein
LKKIYFIIFTLIVLFSCSRQTDLENNTADSAATNVSSCMNQALSQTCLPGYVPRIESIKRRVILDNIVHYTMTIKIGAGEYDRIAVHRVVKEKIPGIPVSNTRGLMMLHGSPANFEFCYLPSTVSRAVPPDQSMAIYFAGNNVDVWGIDMRTSLVPKNISDFSFMKNLDLSVDLKDIDFCLAFARTVRGINGCGNSRMILTGVSFGAFECYAMANAEAGRPRTLRNISAILPVEIVYKFDPKYQNLKDAAYARYRDLAVRMRNGEYENLDGLATVQASELSKYSPDDPSPIITGFTNKQAFLFLMTSTFATSQPPLEPYVPFYHYLEGRFDENGMPTGLKYTDINLIYDLSKIMPIYDSQSKLMDLEAVLSDKVDVPYDDHLGDVDVPVFYIGSAGGFGKYGLYILDLLSSNDKKSLIISYYPDEYAALDYGHADLMWTPGAKDLAWRPMLDWIKIH